MSGGINLNLNDMKIEGLKDYAKSRGFQIKGMWKMKKNELVEAITNEEKEYFIPNGKYKSYSVLLINAEKEVYFSSSKEATAFFNKVHGTNYRSDLFWYLARGRNKKAFRQFEIDVLHEL